LRFARSSSEKRRKIMLENTFRPRKGTGKKEVDTSMKKSDSVKRWGKDARCIRGGRSGFPTRRYCRPILMPGGEENDLSEGLLARSR